MKTIKKHILYLVADESKLDGDSLKDILERYLNKNIDVHVFNTKESCLYKLKHSVKKPEVIVLDHKFNNKKLDDKNALHTMDEIKKSSPKSRIIIISEAEDMPSAVKALKHGAQEYVLKDQFLFFNIGASVKQCLHPSKV